MRRATITQLEELAEYIDQTREEVIRILTHISTFPAAMDEIERSIATLKGARKELAGFEEYKINRAAVYLPPNVLLFSYVLYVAIPSVFVNQITFRPSVRARDETYSLYQHFQKFLKLPARLSYDSRSYFWNNFTSRAELVVFNGRCKNALEVGELTSAKQLFLYFGTGVNPFIVGPQADINLAVKDLISIRMYNSGQDCLCPDLILVHDSIKEKFIENLKIDVSKLRYGSLNDKHADYSHMNYPDTSEFVYEYLKKRNPDIVFGGKVTILDRFIEPTILVSEISQLMDLPEFFSPIFNVGFYNSKDDIVSLLHSKPYTGREMGVMLYGADELKQYFIDKHTVTINKTLFDINDGNKPFGGKGLCASHARYNKNIYQRPILLSKEVREFLIKEK